MRKSPRDHPRSRGEYAHPITALNGPTGSSPLSRGILPGKIIAAIADRIIPALAGNTSHQQTRRSGQPDHPRSRGEYGHAPDNVGGVQGSSPLSRGIRNPVAWRGRDRRIIPALAGNTYSQYQSTPGLGIIPALAGNTRAGAAPAAPRQDHPRSRGEYQGCGLV